jgi:hypothetical protein
MCCRHGARRQPPIVALAGAIYGAYQTRKEKRASASSQDIGIEGGKYVVVPQQSLADAVDGQVLHEKGVAPPDYDDVIRNDGGGMQDGSDRKDDEFGPYDDREEEDPFLAPGEDDGSVRRGLGKREGVKMGFFERLCAKKEEKRAEREERRESWRAERRSWVECRAERRAQWRAGRGRRGCGRQAC